MDVDELWCKDNAEPDLLGLGTDVRLLRSVRKCFVKLNPFEQRGREEGRVNADAVKVSRILRVNLLEPPEGEIRRADLETVAKFASRDDGMTVACDHKPFTAFNEIPRQSCIVVKEDDGADVASQGCDTGVAIRRQSSARTDLVVKSLDLQTGRSRRVRARLIAVVAHDDLLGRT